MYPIKFNCLNDSLDGQVPNETIDFYYYMSKLFRYKIDIY